MTGIPGVTGNAINWVVQPLTEVGPGCLEVTRKGIA